MSLRDTPACLKDTRKLHITYNYSQKVTEDAIINELADYFELFSTKSFKLVWIHERLSLHSFLPRGQPRSG